MWGEIRCFSKGNKPCLITAATLSELKLCVWGDVEFRRKLLQPIKPSLWRLWGIGRAIFVKQKSWFEGLSFDRITFPGSTVNFCLKHVIHILKAFHVEVHLRYLGPFLVHLWHQNFAVKLHIRSYIIWHCVVTQMESIVKRCFRV